MAHFHALDQKKLNTKITSCVRKDTGRKIVAKAGIHYNSEKNMCQYLLKCKYMHGFTKYYNPSTLDWECCFIEIGYLSLHF